MNQIDGLGWVALAIVAAVVAYAALHSGGTRLASRRARRARHAHRRVRR